MKIAHQYHEHPDFNNDDLVKELLAFEISENDYDPKYLTAMSSHNLNWPFTTYPILKREPLNKYFLKFNLVKKLAIEDESLHEEVEIIRQRLINHNLRIIPYVLRNIKDRDEYLASGYIALRHAVDRYDVNLGFAFNTYAGTSIWRQCLVSKNDRLRSACELTSFNSPSIPDVTTKIDDDENIYVMLSHLETLTTKIECDIIKRAFGIGGYEAQKLEDIGKAYGVSKERARQIKEKGLRKLQIHFAAPKSMAKCI